MASQAKVTATVAYENDESSWRAATSRSRQQQEEWKRIVEASNRDAAKFQAEDWKRNMNQHSGPSALPEPGFVAQIKAEQKALEAMRAGINAQGGAGSVYGPNRMTLPPIVRRQHEAIQLDPERIEKTRMQMEGLARSTLTANQAMMTGAKGATNQGMGMLMLSQALDDAQYGFKGIVNNIAPMVMSMGGSAGLAGALTVIAVGFNQLNSKMGDFLGLERETRIASQNLANSMRAQAREVFDAGLAGEKTVRARSRRVADTQSSHDRMEFLRGAEDDFRRMQSELEAKRRATQLRNQNPDENFANQQIFREQTLAQAQNDQASIAGKRNRLYSEIASAKQELEGMGHLPDLRKELEDLQREAEKRADELKGMRESIQEERSKNLGRGATRQMQLAPMIEDREKKQQRQAYLEKIVPQMEGRFDELGSFLRNGVEMKKTAIDDEEKKNRLKIEMRRAEEKEAREAKMRENTRKWADDVQKMRESFQDWHREQSNVLNGLRAEIAARNENLRHLQEENRIAKLRIGGHEARANRAQREETRRVRIKELQDQGVSASDAEQIAKDEEDIRRGRRTIRRVKGDSRPNSGASGLDGFDNRQRGFTPQTPSALDEARRDRGLKIGEPKAPEKPTVGKDVGGIAQMASQFLEELRKITKNTEKTTQSKIAPADK